MVKITEDLIRKRSEHNECLLSTLEEVALHQEDIECIEHIQNWCRYLKILLLQSNLIGKIENLHKLKRLEYLNLAMNNIERLENLEGLESLNKLDLTLNFIGELTSIESLVDNYNLKELILTGNPCCEFPKYREYVIATLPQLESLDCEEIKNTDRLLAKRVLDKNRAIIIQKQANYAIERDEQKIRYQQHKEELDTKMNQIEDEEERNKAFWQSTSEHCPEIRVDIAKYHKKCREPKECKLEKERKELEKRGTPRLFAPCGRPYNLNQAKLPFVFKDERSEFILELSVYKWKYLDTSQLQVDIQPNYIRVTVKGKIFQLSLSQEVKIDGSVVQRSQISGELMVRVPKLHSSETLIPVDKRAWTNASLDLKKKENESKGKKLIALKGTVDIKNICRDTDPEIPELI